MKHKSSTIAFIIALMFFIMSVTAFVFLYIYIQSKNKEAIDSHVEWQTEESRRSNVKSMEAFLGDSTEDQIEIDKHFVKNADIVSFLDLIESFAPSVGAEAEVTLINIPKEGAGLLVEINSKGNFESVYKFLSLLENAPYELEIVSVSLRSSPLNDGGSSLWEAKFKIKLLSLI